MAHAPGFLKLVNEAKTRVPQCTVDDLKQKLDRKEPILVVDVREESEFARDHIPGSIHLSKGVIERDIETKVPDPNTPLYLYCGGGFRSALSADNLQRMGYKSVISVDGGYRGWKAKGYPLVRE